MACVYNYAHATNKLGTTIMALKLSITKAAFDKLPDSLKTEYYAKGDGYALDVQGLPDVDALTTAKDDAITARLAAETRARTAESKLNEVSSELESTKTSFESKLAEQLGEKETALNKANTYLQETLVKSVAKDAAGDISNAPAIVAEFIGKRLSVDMSGDAPKTIVLDADGKPSTLTIDELKQEFVSNKDFASVIKVNKATGGQNGPNRQPNTTYQPPMNGDKPKMLTDMTPDEIVAYREAQSANNGE